MQDTNKGEKPLKHLVAAINTLKKYNYGQFFFTSQKYINCISKRHDK